MLQKDPKKYNELIKEHIKKFATFDAHGNHISYEQVKALESMKQEGPVEEESKEESMGDSKKEGTKSMKESIKFAHIVNEEANEMASDALSELS